MPPSQACMLRPPSILDRHQAFVFFDMHGLTTAPQGLTAAPQGLTAAPQVVVCQCYSLEHAS
eukprot:1160137-Pelagomonas_calceolata.AAC.5